MRVQFALQVEYLHDCLSIRHHITNGSTALEPLPRLEALLRATRAALPAAHASDLSTVMRGLRARAGLDLHQIHSVAAWIESQRGAVAGCTTIPSSPTKSAASTPLARRVAARARSPISAGYQREGTAVQPTEEGALPVLLLAATAAAEDETVVNEAVQVARTVKVKMPTLRANLWLPCRINLS